MTGAAIAAVVLVGLAQPHQHPAGLHPDSEDHGMPMVAVPAAAMVPTAPVLPRTGWTAVASDQETVADPGQASNVLDGNAATSWVSKWKSPAVPLPHSITIDMKAAREISALVVKPRGGSANGRIGRYEVALSANGTTFSAPVSAGTWADDAADKTAAFAAQSARFVRLTGLTEAGGRGPWTSVAEITMLGPTPVAPALYRSGWKATASDEENSEIEASMAGNVLDGKPATFWVSKWRSPAKPLPHSITIEMPAAANVSGLRYLPRGSANGRIGAYTIAASTDGVAFTQVVSGTFPDVATEQTVTFPGVQTRFVRLTATTEAGNRGPWSAAAEINLLGTGGATPPPGNIAGSWSPMIGFPIVPASTALLPNNKVLTWSAYSPIAYGHGGTPQTQVAVLDLATNQVSQRLIVNTSHEMFCTGISALPDGRILITGGSGNAKTTIYNPANDSWTAGPVLNIPRGYQSDVTLSTGQVFTLGGSWSGGDGGKDGEVYTPDGTWRRVPGVTADKILTAEGVHRADNHAWLFAIGNGGVFHAGPSKQMNWITTAGNGTMTAAGNRADDNHAMNGTAVMYDAGKILTAGGAPFYSSSTATTNAYTIDISAGPGTAPKVTKVGSMAGARAYHNSAVLPDGKVFVVGGQSRPVLFTDSTPALTPELWDPASGQFAAMAPIAVPRNYHSVATLLPDGRVFSGGGGLCGNCATNHADGQIFTPPNLLNADGSAKARPTITTAPVKAAPGATVSVTTGAAVSSFALIRMGTATHTVNTDQRRIALAAGTPAGTTYKVAIPASTGTVVPGNYLLFALDATGTWSVGKVINIR